MPALRGPGGSKWKRALPAGGSQCVQAQPARPDYQSLSQSVSLESQLSNTSLEESFEDSW